MAVGFDITEGWRLVCSFQGLVHWVVTFSIGKEEEEYPKVREEVAVETTIMKAK